MNDQDRSHPLVNLAREAIASYLSGKPLPQPDTIEYGLEPAGAFVSLKKGGRLRGCIGTLQPVQPTLALEIVENAVSAATKDPRFEPLTLEELDHVNISVDVLSVPEPVSGPEDLDPSKYGVIVKSGWRKGVLLPDLPGVNSAREQVGIARQKAGIGENEPVQLERFEVRRYT